ncbi:MAG: hypothetical protein RR314_07080 [Oscillospiraceae bacterium]
MENGQTTRFFLGANSGAGFYSLYDDFAAGENDFLHVLKGGPGTGKSAFMRRIGAAAESAGLAVEYILCSGDPDSLDGVYLPSRHCGWVDGTAPHAADPRCFGVTGGYIDLGAYCDTSALGKKRREIEAISREYKQLYARAYSYLSAARAAAPACRTGLITEAEQATAIRRALASAARELPKARKGAAPGAVSRRFASALTCQGRVFEADSISTLCKRVYVLDNRLGLAGVFLNTLLFEAVERGVDAILCPDPLSPATPEALLLPSLSLGFLALGRDSALAFDPVRHVRLDALVPSPRLRELRPLLRGDERMQAELLASAYESLAAAKALHDGLELLYNPHVDFPAVRARADEEIRRVTDF